MPTDTTVPRSIFEDFALVIADADLADLRTVPNDIKCKDGRFGQVSIQGMILDAIQEHSLSSLHAMRLLVMCNQRLNGHLHGFSKVTDAGDLIPIW